MVKGNTLKGGGANESKVLKVERRRWVFNVIIGIMNAFVIVLLGFVLKVPSSNTHKIDYNSSRLDVVAQRLSQAETREGDISRQIDKLSSEIEGLRNGDIKEIRDKVFKLYEIMIQMQKNAGH